MLTDGNFIFVPQHNDHAAVCDNPISQEYLVDAMSNYLANFGPLPDTSVVAAPPSVATNAPIPSPIDDPHVTATTVAFYQPSLTDFCPFHRNFIAFPFFPGFYESFFCPQAVYIYIYIYIIWPVVICISAF